MKNTAKYGLLPVCLLLSCIQTFAIGIEIFTDSNHPVAIDSNEAGLQVKTYQLDVGPSALATLNQQLKNGDPNEVVNTAQNLLANPEFASEVRELKGNFLAAQYGLTLYPAIVVNQEAILYGYSSLQIALGVYQSWKDLIASRES